MFKLKIETGNDSFGHQNLSAEVASILRQAADRVERGQFDGVLFDLNGNRVGEFDIGGED